MNGFHQQTLKNTITFAGIGLHSGHKLNVILRPAPIDTGIVFRTHSKDNSLIDIPARFQNIGALTYNTTLSAHGVQVQTVEHLLSAFHGYQIDNAIVEIDNGEVPVMDGSAAPFMYLFSEAGVAEQNAPRRTARLTAPVRVESGNAWIEARPSDEPRLSVEYLIDFNHPSIGRMIYAFAGDPRTYSYAIAPARTFGFMKEVEFLRRQGLIRGASMQNAVVMDDQRVISGNLRFRDEFVRHKILDFWGDIILLGRPFIAKVKVSRAGHKLHAMLVEKLLASPELLEPVVYESAKPALQLSPIISDRSAAHS
jgi:UDP-3-O-[3-hydroxymyristoyl] N-acetylglucosamine deacetylase